MSGRRGRSSGPPASTEPVKVPAVRQTRGQRRLNETHVESKQMPETQLSSKRATRSTRTAYSDVDVTSPVTEIPRRGTRRQRRRSIESLATGDLSPKSSGENASSEPEEDHEPVIREEDEKMSEVEPQESSEEEPQESVEEELEGKSPDMI